MNRRYNSIDMMRIIAAFCVVFGHFRVPGTVGNLIWLTCLFSVPFFFLASGFLVSSLDERECGLRIKKGIKHATFLFLGTALGYFLFNILYFVIYKNSPLLSYLQEALSTDHIVSFLFLNIWPFTVGPAIWYLQALLYTYIIFYLLNKFHLLRYSMILAVIFLVINSVLGEFCWTWNMKEVLHVDYIGYNFFTRAIPYMLLGNAIRRNLSNVKKMNDKLLISFMVGSVFLTFFEYYLMKHFGVLDYYGHFQGNMILAISCFLLMIKRPNLGGASILPEWGRRYSLPIYLIHQPVGWIIEALRGHFHMDYIVIVEPIIIFFVCIILTEIYIRIKQRTLTLGVSQQWFHSH